ncbi:MAG: right-handed parallel beta-helix repeat-containing protein, partial [Acidobacteriota bacterium]|nr:right-handed parallel beta-helix repeat-containing protein [Acidobacteriota bacterium]
LVRDDIAESPGVGVEFSGAARGALFACDIHHNGGPGIVVSDSAAPAIENNVVFENGLRPDSPLPGILLRSTDHVGVVRNIIAGNGAEALWLTAPDETLIEQNSFSFAGKPDGRPKFRIVSSRKGPP